MQILSDLFAPLHVALRDRHSLAAFLKDLNWTVTFNDRQVGFFRSAMAVVDLVEEIADLAAQLVRDGLDGGVVEQLITKGEQVFDLLSNLDPDEDDLLELPHPFNDAAAWQEMALRLPEYLVVTYLETHQPLAFETLAITGLVIETERDEGDRTIRDRSIDWAGFGELFTDPVARMQSIYGWGADFDFDTVALRLLRLIHAIGFVPRIANLRPELLDLAAAASDPASLPEIEIPILEKMAADYSARLKASLLVAPAAGPGGGISGIAVTNLLNAGLTEDIEFAEDWVLTAEASGDLDRAFEAVILPSGIELQVRSGTVAASLDLVGQPKEPWILIGEKNKARLELGQFRAGIAMDATANEQELAVTFSTRGAEGQGIKLVISPGDGDGFIADLLGDQEIAVTADLGGIWSSKDGFKFDGGVGFEIEVPLSVTWGPLKLSGLRLGLAGGSDGATLEAAISGGVDLEVLAVAVEDIGIRARAFPTPQGEKGLLGPVDMSLGFKPPKGLGLVVDAAGVVTGGGYLYHDEALAEYGGVAELGFIALKLSAIGILTTRMPDGSDGWSLFLSVFSEFPPIQLGFGFTLNGVGGLVGLHRTFDDEALRERFFDGAMDSIMFPADPVANAPQILSDIRAVFPPCQGQFLFGAMMKLGWGTPSILTLELGVIVELPDPIKIVLLGQLGIVLPRPEAAIIEINMDVLGVANITEGTLALDATIRDSHILHLFTLSGDMAFRARFGDAPTMLMSIGGWHPKFTPPPEVPKLKRMKASLPLGNLAAVDLSCYVAITSNTFQTGGRLDIWVKASGFTAEGYFAFDALIQFSPFGFEFAVGFGVSVRAGKVKLMGVDVHATIVGPGPWVITGYAEFEILKMDKRLDLDFEVGERKQVTVESYDVSALLIDALGLADAWSVDESRLGALNVVLRDRGDGEAPAAHPAGDIVVRQTVVPLGLKIDKFGNGTVTGPREFAVINALVGGQPETPQDDDAVTEWFAPANYFVMSDAEKLKAPSYEPLQSGIRMGGGETLTGGAFSATPDVEEIIVDPELNQYIGRQTRKPEKTQTTRRRSDQRKSEKAEAVETDRKRGAAQFDFRAPRFEIAGKTGDLAGGRMTRSHTAARVASRRREPEVA
ncbi:DUF6603 domain-containing protein [Aestuariivita boseongensis]|uniref:DUF6603 domain-containing protein n=1 Tax=Aestuariivita boseongensis TaxID=1470562 RepID=UPI00067F9A9E|nr:DUF6603 domain-containing protein [Aestuariivita boseongensis]